MRVKKTVDGVTTTYHMAGRVIAGETTDGQTIWYNYDTQSQLISIVYNHVDYFYVRNAQGDILALIDKVGNKVVEYKYDSWGAIVDVSGSMAGSLGKKNPFRYRGYYYDEETGLYYLRRRYYDSTLQRFISADKKDTLLLRVKMVNNRNLFLYCDNNPIIRSDSTGAFWISLVSAVAGAVVGAAVSVCSQIFIERKSVDELDWIDVGASAISGAVGTTSLGRAGQMIVNGILGGGSSLMRGDGLGEVAVNTGFGLLAGRFGDKGAGFEKMATEHIDRMNDVYRMKISRETLAKYYSYERERYLSKLERTKVVTTQKIVLGYGITKLPQVGAWGVDFFIEKRRQDRYITKAPRFGQGPVALLF